MAIDPPEDYIAALRDLALMSGEQYSAMHTAVEDRPQVANAMELVPAIESATGLADADRMLEALMSLITYVDATGESPEMMFESVSASESLSLPSAAQAVLRDRLTDLLDDGPLYILHKSMVLSLEHDLVFLSSRIITDIRPIFGKRIESSPPAAVLHHMLRITYRHAEVTSSRTYALDDRDLRALRDAVDRALSKATALSGIFDGTGSDDSED